MSINDTNDTSPTSLNAAILEAATDWGVSHGRALATMPEIREAVLGNEEVDWLDESDLLWDGLGFDPDILDPDLVAAAEDAAREAAREEGERVIKTMSLDELVAMIRANDSGSPTRGTLPGKPRGKGFPGARPEKPGRRARGVGMSKQQAIITLALTHILLLVLWLLAHQPEIREAELNDEAEEVDHE